jgi:hypothetical protein
LVQLLRRRSESPKLGQGPVSPFASFALLALSSAPEEQLDCARQVAAIMAIRASAMLPRPKPRPDERIRLGYLSADFRQHPVAFQITGLIERHDRRCFEVVGYSSGPDDGSAIRAPSPAPLIALSISATRRTGRRLVYYRRIPAGISYSRHHSPGRVSLLQQLDLQREERERCDGGHRAQWMIAFII